MRGTRDRKSSMLLTTFSWRFGIEPSTPLRSCGYVPQIMCMIEKVTDRTFMKGVEH
jgi:hypothetical protein